jgi:hypothetical protein
MLTRLFTCSLGHRSNTKLLRYHNNGISHNIIEIRICLQNLYNGLSIFLADKQSIQILYMNDHHELSQLNPFDLKMLVFNGIKLSVPTEVSCHDFIKLKQMEYSILSFKADCPLHMEHETDFLSSIAFFSLNFININSNDHDRVQLSLPYCQPNRCDIIPYHTTINRLCFHLADEEEIWKHYMEIPGNVILLRSEVAVNYSNHHD